MYPATAYLALRFYMKQITDFGRPKLDKQLLVLGQIA